MKEQLTKILCDSLFYTFDEEACVSKLNIGKTVDNLLAAGVTVTDMVIQNENDKSETEKIKETTELSVENRLNKLKSFKDNEEFIKQDKERKIKAESEVLVEKIKALRPRIEEVLETGNACLKAGVPLTIHDTYRHDLYADGQFRACDIYHCVGFVMPYRDKEKSVELLGHNEGEKDGYFFRTDGIQVYSIHKQKKCEPLVEDMKRFLKQFDEFESRFYAYVDKMIEKQEKSVNVIKAENKKVSLNDKIQIAESRECKANVLDEKKENALVK